MIKVYTVKQRGVGMFGYRVGEFKRNIWVGKKYLGVMRFFRKSMQREKRRMLGIELGVGGRDGKLREVRKRGC